MQAAVASELQRQYDATFWEEHRAQLERDYARTQREEFLAELEREDRMIWERELRQRHDAGRRPVHRPRPRRARARGAGRPAARGARQADGGDSDLADEPAAAVTAGSPLPLVAARRRR